MKAYQDGIAKLTNADSVVLGISVDTMERNARFAKVVRVLEQRGRGGLRRREKIPVSETSVRRHDGRAVRVRPSALDDREISCVVGHRLPNSCSTGGRAMSRFNTLRPLRSLR